MLQPRIQIRHVPNIPGSATPARCNRRTGVILINDSRWKAIEPTHRLFILLHEYAHIVLNSSDELEVDALAQNMFIEMGYPLSESIKALSRVLTGKNDEHVQRVQAQANRAIDVSNKNSNTTQNNTCMCQGNPRCAKCRQNKTGTFLDRANQTSIMSLPGFTDSFDDYDEDLFGLGKRANDRRRMKLELKYGVKQTKADAKKTVADAKKTLADQGIVDSSGIGGAIKDTVQSITGAGVQSPLDGSGGDQPKPKSKVLMYVAIGVGVLVLVGTTIFLVTRKKK